MSQVDRGTLLDSLRVLFTLIGWCTFVYGWTDPVNIADISWGSLGLWAIDGSNDVFFRVSNPKRIVDQNWIPVTGEKLRNISAGDRTVWAFTINGDLVFRTGISEKEPTGSAWVPVPYPTGFSGPTALSVSDMNDELRVLDDSGMLFAREGVSSSKPEGTGWRAGITGCSRDVTIGFRGLFCLDSSGNLLYRNGTKEDPSSDGTGFETLDTGKDFIRVSTFNSVLNSITSTNEARGIFLDSTKSISNTATSFLIGNKFRLNCRVFLDGRIRMSRSVDYFRCAKRGGIMTGKSCILNKNTILATPQLANLACKPNGHPAVLSDPAIHSQIAATLKTDWFGYWIGLSQNSTGLTGTNTDKEWYWTQADGSKTPLTDGTAPWKLGEPNDGDGIEDGTEDAAVLLQSGEFGDVGGDPDGNWLKDHNTRALCEYPKPTIRRPENAKKKVCSTENGVRVCKFLY